MDCFFVPNNVLTLSIAVLSEVFIVAIEYFWMSLWLTPPINYSLRVALIDVQLPLWVIPACALTRAVVRGYRTGPMTALSEHLGRLYILRFEQIAITDEERAIYKRRSCVELLSAVLFPVFIAVIFWFILGLIMVLSL